MAADSVRMVSLPGDRASRERVVSTPYTIAAAAHTTATRAPWSARKSDKETPQESGSSRTRATGAPSTQSAKSGSGSRGAAAAGAAEVYRAVWIEGVAGPTGRAPTAAR